MTKSERAKTFKALAAIFIIGSIWMTLLVWDLLMCAGYLDR